MDYNYIEVKQLLLLLASLCWRMDQYTKYTTSHLGAYCLAVIFIGSKPHVSLAPRLDRWVSRCPHKMKPCFQVDARTLGHLVASYRVPQGVHVNVAVNTRSSRLASVLCSEDPCS